MPRWPSAATTTAAGTRSRSPAPSSEHWPSCTATRASGSCSSAARTRSSTCRSRGRSRATWTPGRTTGPSSSLHRLDRDADDAVPVGRADRPLAQEAVVAVHADLADPQPRALDRRGVVLERDGTGDARGPQLGVASRPLLEGAGADDVGDREPAAVAQGPRGGAEGLRLVGDEVDDAVGDHGVEAPGLGRRLLDVALEERDVAVAVAVAQRACLGELLTGHVDADDRAGRADEMPGDEGVGAGAGAEVEDTIAGRQLGEVEHVADAGVGVHRFPRDRVEPFGRVAEPLGQRTPQLEVKLAVRVGGDGAVHLADMAADLVEVDR